MAQLRRCKQLGLEPLKIKQRKGSVKELQVTVGSGIDKQYDTIASRPEIEIREQIN